MSIAIQTFTVDITPPVGTWLCMGFNGQCSGVETPIHLRGTIVTNGQIKYVLAAMDFALLCGASHRDVRACMADALAIPIDQVMVQTVHQHDVPGIDREVHAVLAEYGEHIHDSAFWQRVLKDIAAACKRASHAEAQAVAYLKVGAATVRDYASNRRLEKDGSFVWRGSKHQNEEVQALPTGNIDSQLRQTAFYNNADELLLTLSTYASHPQVADRRGLISDDAPGYALRCMEKQWPHAMHMYFTGCGANIANGKFASADSTADISVFGQRLADAMIDCAHHAERIQATEVCLQTETCSLPLSEDAVSVDELRQKLNDDKSSLFNRYMLAKRIYIQEQLGLSYPFTVSRLSFGSVHWYFLPAEMFLEYQQHLHAKHADESVMVAAYGDAFLAYIPTAADFSVGGYEVDFCYLTSDCEQRIHALLDAFN